jgi:hypothetical protein
MQVSFLCENSALFSGHFFLFIVRLPWRLLAESAFPLPEKLTKPGTAYTDLIRRNKKGSMLQEPEDIAREKIDRMLMSAGWAVQDAKAVNLYAKQGVAFSEFELKPGFDTCTCQIGVPNLCSG